MKSCLLVITSALMWCSISICQDFGILEELIILDHIHSYEISDINQDGDKEIMVANNNELYYINLNQDGEYGSPVSIAKQAEFNGNGKVQMKDLNNNSFEDIIWSYGERVEVLFSNGNGSFQESILITDQLFSNPLVVIEDLDNDGYLDIVCSSYSSFYFSWFKNLNGQSFSSPVLISEAYPVIRHILPIDFNLDGLMDLMLIHGNGSNSEVIMMSNYGLGLFAEAYTVPESLGNVAHAEFKDLNGDGKEDLVMKESNNGIIAWYPNDGNGFFPIEEELDGVNFSGGLSIIDIDLDGDFDLFYKNNDDYIPYLSNDGSGNFSFSNIPNSGLSFGEVRYSDLDGDAIEDFIFGTNLYGMGWLKGAGSNTYSDVNPIAHSARQPRELSIFDIDDDGDLDVLGHSAQEEFVFAYLNDGHGGFGAQRVLINNIDNFLRVNLGDIDNDGDVDLIITYANAIARFMNSGELNYEEVYPVDLQISGVKKVRLADLNEDEFLDIVAISEMSNDLTVYYNDGTGDFGPSQIIMDNLGEVSDLHVLDLNEDSKLDILVSAPGTSEVKWLENDGFGNFIQENYISNSIEAQKVEFGDSNGDGFRDYSMLANDTIWLFEYDLLEDNYTQKYIYGAENDVVLSMVFEDFNLDGLDDFAFVNDFGFFYDPEYLVKVVMNDGNGNYTFPVILYDPIDYAFYSQIESADFDGDGDKELIWPVTGLDKIFLRENLFGNGCTDSDACNYSQEAIFDDGSCCFSGCGCSDENAINYNELASCDNGSCEFRVQGVVFYDENEDGVKDENEIGLSLIPLEISNSEQIVFTNDTGLYIIDSNLAPFTLQLPPAEGFPFFTTDESINVLPADTSVGERNFGVSNQMADFDLIVSIYPDGVSSLCDSPHLHNICVQNNGNRLIDGDVTLVIDSLFNGFIEISPIHSISGDTINYVFEHLGPGQVVCYNVELVTPITDYIGEQTTINVEATGFHFNDEVAFGETSYNSIVTCAYDPNDKQSFPSGYSDLHYIQDSTTIEYLIRFQNTGNAPAQTVLITDTLDANIDVESLEIKSYSHSVNPSVNITESTLDFLFENILLPDSMSDPEGSQGFISFSVELKDSLPLLTEVNNVAQIFFDNNPPIITNTTWHTTYDCSLFEVSFIDDNLILIASEGDSYQWFLNDELIQGANFQEYEPLANGIYAVQVSSNFPCSGTSDEVEIIVMSAEDVSSGSIQIYPNPISLNQTLIVENVGGLGLTNLQILNVNGALCLEQTLVGLTKSVISLSDLEAGVYQVVMSDLNRKKIIRKLIVY